MAATVRDLTAMLARECARAGVPGAACAVIEAGAPPHIAVYGERRAGSAQPVDEATIFDAASLGKPVFALAVLQLALRGEFDIDLPLSDYLRDPVVPTDPRAELITGRLALCHRSGLPNWFGDEPPHLIATPGDRFTWSGEAFGFLQRAIEAATGMAFADIVLTEVFAPLSMHESAFTHQDRFDANRATGHDAAGVPVAGWRPARPLAAATLQTSIRDYAAFTAHLLAAEGPAIRGLLTPSTDVEPGIEWGLGIGIERVGRDRIGFQWGDNPGSKSILIADRERSLGVVIFTNSDNGREAYAPIVRAVMGEPRPSLDWIARR